MRCLAGQSLREALQLRLFWLVGAGGIALVLFAQHLRALNFGGWELRFLVDFGLSATGLAGVVLAVQVTVQLHVEAVESGWAACILTRRTGRLEYLAGRLAGVALLLALFLIAAVGVLAGVIAGRGVDPGTVSVAGLLAQATLLLWWKLTLAAAITLLVCTYAGGAVFASCASLMLVAVAHAAAFVSPHGWLAWLRFWPNLSLFDPERLTLAGGVLDVPALAGLGGYWAVFMISFLLLSDYVFRCREL